MIKRVFVFLFLLVCLSPFCFASKKSTKKVVEQEDAKTAIKEISQLFSSKDFGKLVSSRTANGIKADGNEKKLKKYVTSYEKKYKNEKMYKKQKELLGAASEVEPKVTKTKAYFTVKGKGKVTLNRMKNGKWVLG